MGKNFIQGSKGELRKAVSSMDKQLKEKAMQQRQTFTLLGALLNRVGGVAEFTRQELEEVDMAKLIDLQEIPEEQKYVVRWEAKDGEEQTGITARDILGGKSGATAG